MKALVTPILLLAYLGAASQTKVDTLSIEEAMNKKMVMNKITGLDGYQDECFQFSLENHSDRTVWLKVEAGRRLDSADSTMQDILLVQSKKIKLNPYGKYVLPLRGFCCQASLHAPSKSSAFKVGSMASKALVSISTYIATHKLPSQAIQEAIWIISDNHDISSIDNSLNDPIVADLQREVAKIKGIPVPWYTTYYKQIPNQVSSNKRERITAEVDYKATENGKVIIQIISAQGEIIEEHSNFCQRGTYHYHLEWQVENMPSGAYYLKIFDETKTIKNLKIEL